MIRNFDNNSGTSRKLIPKFKGPHVITRTLRNDRCCVTEIEDFQNIGKPYEGTRQQICDCVIERTTQMIIRK